MEMEEHEELRALEELQMGETRKTAGRRSSA
jgi:hypothetical protein